jgi:molybdopterin-containing oxidoreductase family iron-sulfur binding subunit
MPSVNPRKDLSRELASLQDRLETATGKSYWRSLDELANTEAFQELMRREFPEQADIWPNALSRRQFLTLMGASLALAGLSGCSVRPAPSVNLVPYVRAPEEIIPGTPLFYATSMTLGGTAVGLLVESHLGRPTKIEGNPDHPASLGATDLFHQASILTLYDPDRSQTVTYLGQTRTWDEASTALRSAVQKQRASGGAGLRLLTETVVSPTLAQQIREFLQTFPAAKWHQYEPLGHDMAHRGAEMAFGKAVNTYYDFQKADVVLSFDADFLTCGPGNLRYVADFMTRRRIRTDAQAAKQAQMNRLYMVETAVTNTGAKADHRLALRATEIEGVARAIAAKLGIPAGNVSQDHAHWVAAVAKDLGQHRGRCLILAGERQPPAVHLLAHAVNDLLGNVGETVFYTVPIEAQPVDQIASLRALVQDMESGKVEVLAILGGNPVFAVPADFRFVEHMQQVPLRVHLSLYQDETSRQCHWHLSEAHYLEAWSDARAYDGTASIAQPLIAPLYQGRSAHELLAVLTRQHEVPGYETVRAYWRKHWEGHGRPGDFEDFWQTAVHDGLVADTKDNFSPQTVSLQAGWEKRLQSEPDQVVNAQELELVFQADPTIYDGRFANNGWLQELPKPITTLTWDNAAIMSPRPRANSASAWGAMRTAASMAVTTSMSSNWNSKVAESARPSGLCQDMPTAPSPSTSAMGESTPGRSAGRQATRSASTPLRCERRIDRGSPPA